jgi:hypothetical protein
MFGTIWTQVKLAGNAVARRAFLSTGADYWPLTNCFFHIAANRGIVPAIAVLPGKAPK